MPVTPSFPGIYFEELPSTNHTITPAPTSIAVFVGYSHPYKTLANARTAPLPAVFDFVEYKTSYGPLFRNDYIDASLPYAVQQFFNNQGAQAYIVALDPAVHVPGQPPMRFADNPPAATIGSIVFTGLEPIDTNTSLTVNVKNVRVDPANSAAGYTLCDLVVSYGSFVSETFRGVSLLHTSKDYLDKRINGLSTLVTVAPSGASYTAFPTNADQNAQLAYPAAFSTALGNPLATVYRAQDYIDQFQADTPLDKIDIFNLLVMPAIADNPVISAAIPFVEKKRAFIILDPPANATADGMGALMLPTIQAVVDSGVIPRTDHGALYFPYLQSIDELTGSPRRLPPGGYIAGMYAQTDQNRGVWKAPAGLDTILVNTTGVVPDGKLTDPRAGLLNLDNVNCIRTFPGTGTVVFGARCFIPAPNAGALAQWHYVPVRRMALFIEQTLYRNLGWVIFEPNDEPLWVAVRTSIEAFMLGLYRQGAFQGSTPDQAFQVKCDSSTTTQDDINNGIVNILVAFAPLKPAEFVVVQIAQLAGQVQS